MTDWPHEHYNGANQWFHEKYSQHKKIAMEFLDE